MYREYRAEDPNVRLKEFVGDGPDITRASEDGVTPPGAAGRMVI